MESFKSIVGEGKHLQGAGIHEPYHANGNDKYNEAGILLSRYIFHEIRSKIQSVKVDVCVSLFFMTAQRNVKAGVDLKLASTSPGRRSLLRICQTLWVLQYNCWHLNYKHARYRDPDLRKLILLQESFRLENFP